MLVVVVLAVLVVVVIYRCLGAKASPGHIDSLNLNPYNVQFLFAAQLILSLLLRLCGSAQVLPQNWQLLKHSAEGAEPSRNWVALDALGLRYVSLALQVPTI